VQRRPGPVAGDPVAVGEERAALGPRLEVDVLLPDRGPVLDHGIGVAWHRDPALEAQVDVHSVVGEAESVDPADGDAPVGDLGILEDPAGLGEVHGHDVARPQEEVAEPDVAGADEADADHRDDQEDGHLDLDAAADHVSPPIISRARLVS
jgi:hypothetical protein